MELQGKIILIKDTQTVGANGFQKREFVIEYAENPQYPQKVKLEFTKDKTGLLDNFSVGQNVSVEFNIRGSEYNGNYYVTLQAWKIAASGGSSAPKGAAKSTAAAKTAGPRAGGAPRPQAPKPTSTDAGDSEDTPW